MPLEIVVLAAGAGKRMRSSQPKVLHAVAGKPMLQRVLETAMALEPSACHVVVGHGADQVRERIDVRDIRWVEQSQQLGTGHAVLQALPGIADDATVLVLYGDVPLVRPESLQPLLKSALAGPCLLTAMVKNPRGYGRILRDREGALRAVVEEKDADERQRAIQEINTGILAAPAAQLKRWLPRVGNENAQGEYYLPDILAMAVSEKVPVTSASVGEEIEILGVNDRVQLNLVEREYQYRKAEALMRDGVTLADARRIDIRGSLVCAGDVWIDANCVFEGQVQVGAGARIGANCVLIDCRIGDGVEILPFSHLQGATVERDCNIGPFARLREGTHMEAGAKIGNFVETKKARLGAGSKVNHLSYIGDCQMGEKVNVGAGTITCNYDGVNKHQTTMGDGVFIGSNSTLVAPVTIADGGFVGAGSTITRNIAEKQLAVSRAQQRNIDGWTQPGEED